MMLNQPETPMEDITGERTLRSVECMGVNFTGDVVSPGGGESAQMSYMSSGESASMIAQQQQTHTHHSEYMPSVMAGGQGRNYVSMEFVAAIQPLHSHYSGPMGIAGLHPQPPSWMGNNSTPFNPISSQMDTLPQSSQNLCEEVLLP